jgi:hypothetical protein
MVSPQYRLSSGLVFKGYAKFIKKKWGTDGLEACSKAIDLDLTDIIDDKWYPEHYNGLMLEWIKENHGEDYVRQAGFSTATERGVIAFAARLAGIDRVLEKGVEEYRRNFNFGEINIQRPSKKVAIIKLIDATTGKYDCVGWLGAFEGILHITHKKGAVRKTSCQLKGDDCCTYEMEWE